MVYNIFQTDTATLAKITEDGNGDKTTALSFSVDIDPMIGKKRLSTRDGVEIEGMETIISYDSRIDKSHENWELTHDGRTYKVEQFLPVPKIGSNNISHFEVMLR